MNHAKPDSPQAARLFCATPSVKAYGLACITGGIAEAFYGMPQELRDETLKRLPEDIREGYELFWRNIGQR